MSQCKAEQGKCPFGTKENHYPSAKIARAAYESEAQALEESGQVWPPYGLPKKLIPAAASANLIRHFNDSYYGGGEGVCLGTSAFISSKLSERDIPHKLIRGEYTDKDGEKKDHWWVESSGWIIDPSRGQFEEDSYKSGVIKSTNPQYSTITAFEPGHKSIQLVNAELKRCFNDPGEAYGYLEELATMDFEANELFNEETVSERYS